MKTYTINDKPFEFDATLRYCDYRVRGETGFLEQVHLDTLLENIEAGHVPWDAALLREFRLLSRWVHEAPRKRYYRELIRMKIHVCSCENFFPDDDGAAIIDCLENTGKLAVRLLEQYGERGVSPIQHDDPIKPTQVEEILGG